MLSNEKGQSLIEVLVVLVLAAMMIVALITIVLVSLKNAQFAQNQTKATKIAQDTIDNIRILRDSNQNSTLFYGSISACFKELWNNNNIVDNNFYCGSIIDNTDCYYQLNANGSILNLNRIITITPITQKVALADNPGFSRQIKVTQNSSDEVKIAVDVSWTDSSGEHKSSLETYLIKPNYDCI